MNTEQQDHERREPSTPQTPRRTDVNVEVEVEEPPREPTDVPADTAREHENEPVRGDAR